MLEAMERGIERPLPDRQLFVRQLLNAFRDGPAVQRLARQRFQDEEIERALEQIRGFRHGLTRIPRLSTMAHTSIIDKRPRMTPRRFGFWLLASGFSAA